MSAKLLQAINDNYHMALAVHREQADVMWYLSFSGYATLHEYQYIAESIEQRRVKKYITETHHMILGENLPSGANIAIPMIKDMPRKTNDEILAKNALKTLFKIYADWETDTLKKYNEIATQLINNGCVASFNFVAEIVKDVRAELVNVNNMIIIMQAHDYDMPQIIGSQKDIEKDYKKRIEKICMKQLYI